MRLVVDETLTNRLEWLSSLPKGGACAEIGVWTGEFSEEILKRVAPDVLYGIDHWTSLLEGDAGKRLRRSQQENLRETLHRLRGQIATGQYRPVCEWSEKVATWFEDESLDWVYIDAHHRADRVVIDLTSWYPKVKPGGIIAGHDFNMETPHKRVHCALLEFTKRMDVDPVVTIIPEGDAATFWFRKPDIWLEHGD